jgi:branched-chain amino acid transport system ATP-binding protein
LLKVENISTGYGKKQVLFDVSFEVKQGEIVLLAGSNGSGKSTLLKAIYGILPQWSHGKIFFDRLDITGKSTSNLLKEGLLYIPQKDNLFEGLTVKENLEMAGLTIEHKLLQRRMKNTLSIFTTLVPHLNRIPMKLSGGERQMLALAMATLHLPKMILLDEPFIGLSSQNINLVAEIMKNLNEKSGVTLLIIEQRVKECSTIADRVIGLKLGKVILELEVNLSFNINQLNNVFV